MSESDVVSILQEFLWATAIIATPMLVTALVVGVVIGLFQALTSIQELTLTFVPKVAAMMIVFWASAGFMARICIGLFENQVLPVIAQ